MEGVTLKLGLGTRVMKIYTAELKKIQKLEDLVDGAKYLAVCKEGLVKDKGTKLEKSCFNHSVVPKRLTSDETDAAEEPAPAPAPVVKKSKQPVVSAYKSGEISKFGTQAEKAKRIVVFPNAEPNHQGVEMLVSEKKYKTFDQVSCLTCLFSFLKVPGRLHSEVEPRKPCDESL